MATRTRKAPKLITTGPWDGCYQSWDVSPSTASKLFTASNVVFRNTQGGLAAHLRPGFAQLARLGAGSNRTPQGTYQHTRLDGTEDPFVFCGGKMYRWNADTTSPSFTDITPGGVTISTTARIFCTTFANLLIVSDGVNRPWTYNPATTTATAIQFNTAAQAWFAYGPPVVYGNKLFFILGTVNSVSRRNEVAWSEESDPATGYFQDDYDNTWELTQTDADPLTCLCATNTGLYFFRGDSIGCITGLVNADFRTTAVRDAVSPTVGTTSPASVLLAGEYLWFADRLGRPHRIPIGGKPVELWRQIQDAVDSEIAASVYTLTNIERWTCAGFHVELGVVAMVLWSSSSTGTPSATMYTFDAESGVFTGGWQFATSALLSGLGALRDTNKRQVFIALGNNGGSNDGYVFAQRILATGGSSYYQDDSTQFTGFVQTRQLQDDASTEWLFDRIDVEYAGDDSGRAAFTGAIAYKTSRNSPSSQNVSVPAGNVGTQHASAGILGRGRFCAVTASITTTTTTPVPAGFNRITVSAFPDASDPGVP